MPRAATEVVGRSSAAHRELSILLHEQVEPALLVDPKWLFPRVIQLCTSHAQRALSLYRAALEAGFELASVDESDLEPVSSALVTSMIRMGLLGEAMRILRDLRRYGIPLSRNLQASAVKLSTAKHCFQESLAMFDLFAESPVYKPADATMLSCLLFCAVECRDYSRCHSLFRQLSSMASPSAKDYWNMIRFGSANGDWQLMLELHRCMVSANLEVDTVVYNTVLSACVSADRIGEARKLLDEMQHVEGVTDVITYNTLMKGYAKSGKMDECFKLFELMQERGLPPTQVSHGILLDGCISNGLIDRAASVFDAMCKDGCTMNTVLYTTLIKGFARESKVDEAMRVFNQLEADANTQPDLITFSILIKANCDVGRIQKSLELLESMKERGLKPDEVIFNSLLSGCAKESNAQLANRLYAEMVASGVKPSSATFSVLIRLYSQCKLLDDAVEMLQTEPAKHKVTVEMRLYSQLIMCCVRARQGKRAVQVYQIMAQHSPPPVSVHSSMLGMCVKLNMFDTAVELLAIVVQTGGKVDQRDAHGVLEGVRRKRKTHCAESCEASMKALGLAVD